jgi:hypothetical protein
MSANGLRHKLLISANGRNCQLRWLARELLSPVLPLKASSVPKHHQLPLVVTEAQARPEDRVSAASPAVRAVSRRVLQPLPRCREALRRYRETFLKCGEVLLKARTVPEARHLRIREMPEIKSADSTGSIFSDNMQ